MTLIDSVMPWPSISSAIWSADRFAVPRSITRASRFVAPGASAGSHTYPARTARLMATAGVLWVSLASTTTPLSSVERVGDSPGEEAIYD